MRFYYHSCGRCGVPVRRYRQHTLAAWYKRNRLEPRAWDIIWQDASGSSDCYSVHARRWRKEMGWRDLGSGHIDDRHYAVLGTVKKEES